MRAMVTALIVLALPLIALPAAADRGCEEWETEFRFPELRVGDNETTPALCLAGPTEAGVNPVTLIGLRNEQVADTLRRYQIEADFLRRRLGDVALDTRDCNKILPRFRIAALELSLAIHTRNSDIEAAKATAERAAFAVEFHCRRDRAFQITIRDQDLLHSVVRTLRVLG